MIDESNEIASIFDFSIFSHNMIERQSFHFY